MVSLADLRRLRPKILQLAAKYGALNVRIFGSVARGEEKESSDVDVLVEFEPERSLLDLSGLRLDLVDLLGCEVDVVSERGISPYIKPDILRDALPL